MNDESQTAAELASAAIRQLTDAARKESEALAIERNRSASLAAELARALATQHESDAHAQLKTRALEVKIRELQLELSSLQPMQAALESKETILIKTQQTLETTKAEAEVSLKTANAEIKALRLRTEAAEKAREELARKVEDRAALEKAYVELRTRHQSLHEHYRQFHQMASQANEELKRALQNSQRETGAIIGEREQLKVAFAAADKLAARLKAELAETNDKLLKAQTRIASQADKLEEIEERHATIENDARAAEAKARDLEAQMAELTRDKHKADAELAKLRPQVNDLFSKIRALEMGTSPDLAQRLLRWDTQRREIFERCHEALANLSALRASNPLESDPNLNQPGMDPFDQLEGLLEIANKHLLGAEANFERILGCVHSGPDAPPPPPRTYLMNRKR